MTYRRVLLDSHVLVWLLVKDQRIVPSLHALLQDSETVLVSYASLQELAFKYKSGKFPHSPEKLFAGIEQAQLELLPMQPRHLVLYPGIELPHKDPFDTLLMAQSVSEGAPLVTADSKLLASRYETIDACAC